MKVELLCDYEGFCHQGSWRSTLPHPLELAGEKSAENLDSEELLKHSSIVALYTTISDD